MKKVVFTLMTATLLYACKTENNKQTTEQTSELLKKQ